MTLDEELETLRTGLPGCRVTAFLDLNAQLVLLSNAADRPRQEWLDGMARAGAALLPMVPTPLTAGLPGGDLPDHAAILRPDGLRVYVRLPEDPSEALCCDCGSGADPGAVLSAARATLARVLAAG